MSARAEPETKGGLPIRSFRTVKAFETWLAAHVSDAGLWLKIAKAGSSHSSITYAEGLEAAICFGWIDGHKVSYDDDWWLQRFTPRRPRGRWSKINCAKVEALTAAGRMRPEGLAEVEAAKSDGRWDAAYAGQRSAEVPPDLQVALDQSPTAATFFATLNSTNRYAILYRIGSVKRAETRARKIAQYVAMLEAGETIHPQAPPR
jgi:uncharacterized protein YdeI (YjbR/CyaY-like superfamily)